MTPADYRSRLETLAQLAGGITHDFNNLLALIMNYADFVQEALDSPAPPEVEAVFERARADTEVLLQAAEAAAALTHRLLVFDGRVTARTDSRRRAPSGASAAAPDLPRSSA